MHWLDFLIGCCVGTLLGIVFYSWLENKREKKRNRDIEISLQKEIEQLRSLRDES
ncbi:hypothetical protein [Bacillus cereus]|uniref:hypothetical protein n=1 Tax=Bacillus cereus TaxID=1396 RepID=UPI0018D05C8B|nr:hypothetical protein [Bacillus cereus]